MHNQLFFESVLYKMQSEKISKTKLISITKQKRQTLSNVIYNYLDFCPKKLRAVTTALIVIGAYVCILEPHIPVSKWVALWTCPKK